MSVATSARNKTLSNEAVSRVLATNSSPHNARDEVMRVVNSVDIDYSWAPSIVTDHLIVPSPEFQIVIGNGSFKFGLDFKSSSNSLLVIANKIDRPGEFLFATAKRFPKSILGVEEGVDVFSVGSSMERGFSFVVSTEGGHVCAITKVDHNVRPKIEKKTPEPIKAFIMKVGMCVSIWDNKVGSTH
jgi:hypothetical protein